jgi:hypothetical protein
MQKTKTAVKRYRVLRVNLDKTLDPTPVEEWLNEASDDHRLYDVIREDGVLLLIQSLSCRAIRKLRIKKRAMKAKKTVATKKPAKKATAKKQTQDEPK